LGPKGSNFFNISKNPGVISFKLSSVSISICGISCSGVIISLTTFSNLSLSFGIFSILRVSPAAYLWPPKLSSRSEHSLIALYRSNPITERADPVANPFDSVRIIVGL